MDVSIIGTVLNPDSDVPSPFAVQFSIAGGTPLSAGCDSALMGASVTGFSAEIGNNPVLAPRSFDANITSSPWPSCSDTAWGNFIGGPLTLESKGTMFATQSTLFGSIGHWQISNASFTVSAAPEPGSFPLLALGLGVMWLVSRRRTSS